MRFRSTMLMASRARQVARAQADDPSGLMIAQHAATTIVTYLICTNPRSGSYLLCDGLASTALAGRPREWLNRSFERYRRRRWGLDHPTDTGYAAFLDQVRVRSTTPNGISGIKLHLYQFNELAKKLADIEGFEGLTTAAMMAKAFPGLRYLFLTRRDKARQAISLLLAAKTGDWLTIDGTTADKGKSTVGEYDFEPREAARLEESLMKNDAAWRSYFTGNKISPLTVYYEDLAADYGGTVVKILEWLGIPNAGAVVVRPPRLQRQSNGRNEQWLARYTTFKAEHGTASNQEQC